MKKILLYILAALAIGAIIGGFIGHKILPPPAPLPPSTALDSLIQVNKVLTDSLSKVKASDREIIRTITVWRTQYDTIRVKQDINEVIKGLNYIGQYPIDTL